MEKVREMVNTHLPVVLKVVNTVAFVAIAASTICAADSLKEMSGKGAAPAAVTETNYPRKRHKKGGSVSLSPLQTN